MIEATVAAICEQMEERLADRDSEIAGLCAERQELRWLVTDVQRTKPGVRAELDARRARGLRRRFRWALSRSR